MALGNNVILDVTIDGNPTTPARVECPWTDVVTAPETADNGGSAITDPTAEITNATSFIFTPNIDAGSLFAVRLKYDDGLSSITDAVINVFGRFDSDDDWQRLESLAGIENCTLTTDLTNDVSDGTFNFTSVDQTDNVFHTQGCREFLIGIKTAFDGTGTKNTSTIQVRFID